MQVVSCDGSAFMHENKYVNCYFFNWGSRRSYILRGRGAHADNRAESAWGVHLRGLAAIVTDSANKQCCANTVVCPKRHVRKPPSLCGHEMTTGSIVILVICIVAFALMLGRCIMTYLRARDAFKEHERERQRDRERERTATAAALIRADQERDRERERTAGVEQNNVQVLII